MGIQQKLKIFKLFYVNHVQKFRAWCRLLCLFSLLLVTACSEPSTPAWSGYAEGDYVYIAAPLAGQIESVAVQAGQKVAKNAVLFALDAQAEHAASDEAAAHLASARAQVANLDKGRGSDEIAVTQAQLAQAQATAVFVRSELARQQQLCGARKVGCLDAFERLQSTLGHISPTQYEKSQHAG